MNKEKTHFRKIKDPNWLGSWDLMNENGGYDEITLTITKAGNEEIVDHRGQKSKEAILYFDELKPMILNHTNVRAVVKACESPYIEDWAGRKVNVFVTQVKAFGDTHDALRIKPMPVKIIAKPKEKLSEKRFDDALNALKQGKTTEAKIKGYDLTDEQSKQLAEFVKGIEMTKNK